MTAADFDGAYTFTYDALGRPATSQDLWGLRLTFTYDANGNRTKVEDSLGGVATTTYDALNQLASREFGGGFTTIKVDASLNAAGQVGSYSRYSGGNLYSTTDFTYDGAGRLSNLHHKNSTGTSLANTTYTYDARSRPTAETRNGTARNYSYDNTDQLTGDGTNSFSYDANGNRTNAGYSTSTGNRLSSDGTWTYSYDDEGNRTKKSLGSSAETWTFGYDQRSQLIWVEKRATDGGTLQQRVEFKYDAFGNRVEKKVDADGNGSYETTQRYAVEGFNPAKSAPIGNENWDVWADLDGSNSLTTRYLRGDAVDQVFAHIAFSGGSSTSGTFLTDHLGSIRDIVNSSGNVVDTIVYDGFGNITSETDSTKRARYAWTGREYDVEIGLQYNRARYYDASTGRWISQDPLGFGAGDGNLYRAMGNRTTNATDPSGMQDESPYDWLSVFPVDVQVFFLRRLLDYVDRQITIVETEIRNRTRDLNERIFQNALGLSFLQCSPNYNNMFGGIDGLQFLNGITNAALFNLLYQQQIAPLNDLLSNLRDSGDWIVGMIDRLLRGEPT